MHFDVILTCVSLYLLTCVSLYLLTCVSLYLLTCVSLYLLTCVSLYLLTCVSLYLLTCVSLYLLTCVSLYLLTCVSLYLLTCVYLYLLTCVSLYLLTCVSLYLLTCVSLYLLTCVSLYLLTCVSLYLLTCVSLYLLTFVSLYLLTRVSLYLLTCVSLYLLTCVSQYLLTRVSLYLLTCVSLYLLTMSLSVPTVDTIVEHSFMSSRTLFPHISPNTVHLADAGRRRSSQCPVISMYCTDLVMSPGSLRFMCLYQRSRRLVTRATNRFIFALLLILQHLIRSLKPIRWIKLIHGILRSIIMSVSFRRSSSFFLTAKHSVPHLMDIDTHFSAFRHFLVTNDTRSFSPVIPRLSNSILTISFCASLSRKYRVKILEGICEWYFLYLACNFHTCLSYSSGIVFIKPSISKYINIMY